MNCGTVPKDILRSFSSNIGTGEFFSQAGNLVSIEQALAVLGVLSPNFVERDEHIFWTPNANEYIPENFPLLGFRKTELGELKESRDRKDVERYRNNFPVSQFFTKWEDTPDKPFFRVGLSQENYDLCHAFAAQITKYWRSALAENFPDRDFEFETGDDLLDEYGVCVTFWQKTLDHAVKISRD